MLLIAASEYMEKVITLKTKTSFITNESVLPFDIWLANSTTHGMGIGYRLLFVGLVLHLFLVENKTLQINLNLKKK